MKQPKTQKPTRPTPSSESQPAPTGPTFAFRQTHAVALGAAVVASLIICFFFCPRYVWWRGFDELPARNTPEVNRAYDTWEYAKDPSYEIKNPSNQVVRWRVLFPRLAYYLHLPRTLFLSLSHIGCIVALAVVFDLMRRETGSRRDAFFSTLLFGSGSWFFTSMGWLTYFDSWYILGLILVSFVRSYWVVAAACVITPWIDERFIITLPVCLLVRALYFDWLRTQDWKAFWVSALIMAGLTGPYVALRLAAMFGGWDEQSSEHMKQHLDNQFALSRYFRGTWHGLRFGWAFVLLLLGVVAAAAAPAKSREAMQAWTSGFRERGGIAQTTLFFFLPPVFALLCWLVIPGICILLQRIVAGDISRTAAAPVPAAIMGAILLYRLSPQWFSRVVPWLALLNLAAPAEHTITTFEIPIRYVYAEYDNVTTTASSMDQRGWQLFQQISGQTNHPQYREAIDASRQYLDAAVAFSPDYWPARFHRSQFRVSQNELPGAFEDANQIVRNDPGLPEGYFVRASVLQAMGKLREALSDLETAARIAAANKHIPYSFAQETPAAIQQLQQRLQALGS